MSMFSSSMFVFLATALVSFTSWAVDVESKAVDGLDSSTRVKLNFISTTDCLYRIREANLQRGSFYINDKSVPVDTINSIEFGPNTAASFMAGDALAVNGSLSVYHNDMEIGKLYFQGVTGSDMFWPSTENGQMRHSCTVKSRLGAASSQSQWQSQGENVRFDQAMSKTIDLECREVDSSLTLNDADSVNTAEVAALFNCKAHGTIYYTKLGCKTFCPVKCNMHWFACRSYKKCEKVKSTLSLPANVTNGTPTPILFGHNYKCHCKCGGEDDE